MHSGNFPGEKPDTYVPVGSHPDRIPKGETERKTDENIRPGSIVRKNSQGQQSATKFIERKTALRGAGIAPSRPERSVRRKDTWGDLNERNPEIPYVKAELAIRDLVCSLMERQDRMNEELLRRIIDLQYRMDDIEGRMPEPADPDTEGDRG